PAFRLSCIADYRKCAGNEDFFGLPPENERVAFLERMRAWRESHVKIQKYQQTLWSHYFPATSQAVSFLNQLLRPRITDDLSDVEKQNRQTISRLIKAYGTEAIFVHIPTKREVKSGEIERQGAEVDKYIVRMGGILFD